jgi:hypothetical protein
MALTEGTKNDQGKSRLDLISPALLFGVGDVLAFGAKKYEDWNWAKGILYSRVIGAAIRHMIAYSGGENNDEETNMSHLFHAGCCLMFLAHYDSMPHLYSKFDDRPDFEQLVLGAPDVLSSE